MSGSIKYKLGALFTVVSAVYLGITFFSTLSVNVVVMEPDNCRKIATFPPERYRDFRYFAEIALKKKAKKLGADTLYVPIGVSNINVTKGMLTGTAYSCSST